MVVGAVTRVNATRGRRVEIKGTGIKYNNRMIKAYATRSSRKARIHSITDDAPENTRKIGKLSATYPLSDECR